VQVGRAALSRDFNMSEDGYVRNGAALPHGAGGHRVEADRRALSQRAVEVWVKNPASEAVRRERKEEWRWPRRTPAFMLSPVICSSCLLRSPSGQQDDGEHSHGENDGGDPGNFDVGNPS
jgi:hypothetical protein